MDRALYVAMGGASQTLAQQAVVSANLANLSTTGFRAQLNNYLAVPVLGQELPTRAFVVETTPGADLSEGPVTQTGRPLDVAVRGAGWLVVQTADGEAFTRSGELQVSADGQLTTQGRAVLGEGGALAVPPGSLVHIASDGLVSARLPGDAGAGMTELGRLRRVNPPPADLQRGEDGLFRLRAGAAPAQDDPTVRLLSGAVEGSNVNAVEAMVALIANARRFEMQMKALQTADTNAQSANKLLAAG